MKNESAVGVSVVNVRPANVNVLDLSVGEDKTKTLRQKKILRMARTVREIDTTNRRTIQYRHRTARCKASNVKPRT